MCPGAKWFILIQSSQLFKPGAIIVSVSQMKKIETHTGSNLLSIRQLIRHCWDLNPGGQLQHLKY